MYYLKKEKAITWSLYRSLEMNCLDKYVEYIFNLYINKEKVDFGAKQSALIVNAVLMSIGEIW